MNIYSSHIPYSKEHRPNQPLDFQYVTIHNTGNPKSTAKNERAWLTNPSNTRVASWHIVIDENDVIEAIPTGLKEIFPNTSKPEVAYHAGNSTGNKKSIGIEICESGNYAKAVQNAVKIVAKILYIKGWSVERVKQHYDWSGKNCPRLLRQGNNWQKFIADVQKELNNLKKGDEKMANQQLAQWQIDLGNKAIDVLVKEGLINNPEDWKKKLGENTPNWLFFTMFQRLVEKVK